MIDIVKNRCDGICAHTHLVKIGKYKYIDMTTTPDAKLNSDSDVSPICPVCGRRINCQKADSKAKRYKSSVNAIEYFEFVCGNCNSVFRTDPFIYDHEAASYHIEYALSSTKNVRFFNTPKEMDKYIKTGLGKFDLESDPLWPIFVVPILIILALALFEGVLLHYGGSIHIGPLEITTKLLVVLMCICAAISVCHYFIFRLKNGREYNFPRK